VKRGSEDSATGGIEESVDKSHGEGFLSVENKTALPVEEEGR
jgi:hypothetical protein